MNQDPFKTWAAVAWYSSSPSYAILFGHILIFFLMDGWMQVVRNGGDAKSAGNDLKLESGLGIFDAFFASLSMILVSEVIGLSLSPAVFLRIDA